MMKRIVGYLTLALTLGLSNQAMAQENGAAAGTVVLDGNSLWHYFAVSRASFMRADDKGLHPVDVNWVWGSITSKDSEEICFSPLPPANWQSVEFDDSDWPRRRLPQPTTTISGANPRPFYKPYSVGIIVSRGKFVLDDPATVKECSISLDYWGGVAIFVNGKEVARGHLPAGAVGERTVAEDYPMEAFLTPEGKPLLVRDTKNSDRLAKRMRSLKQVAIPTALLRKGVNVVAIEAVQAPVPQAIAKGGIGQRESNAGWPPIGLLEAEVRVVSSGKVTPSCRPTTLQLWNCAPSDTVSAFDYGDPAEPLRPIVMNMPRNGTFSGRLMVSAPSDINGLKVSVSDLRHSAGKGAIAANSVRVRIARQGAAGESWVSANRFDALVDTLPATIAATKATFPKGNFYWLTSKGTQDAPAAVAPLWFTIKSPADCAAGLYEGVVTVSAAGVEPLKVPLRLTVSDWVAPDPKAFRVNNFGYISEDALAQYYEVPLWSERHLQLISRSMTLMSEVNSREAKVNLVINYYGGNKGDSSSSNEESLARWIADGKGGYKYDFTNFDKYLDMVERTIGKPTILRVNCWGETKVKGDLIEHDGELSARYVTLFDPTSGKLDKLAVPAPGTEESFAFWKPVLDEARKRIEARGWWDITTMGHSSYCYPAKPAVNSLLHRIWPDAAWYYTAHNGTLGMRWPTLDKKVTMPVRYADTVWNAGKSTARGYSALLKERSSFWNFTYRGCFHDNSPLVDLRRIAEDEIMMGHNGVSDFGVDLFPLKDARGRAYLIGNGRGTGGPGNSTRALLAPGADGPMVTERFEMLREGVQLAEAILFIQQAVESGKLSGNLLERVNQYLDARGNSFLNAGFDVWYMQSLHDAKLLGLAGEVARLISP